MAFDTNTTINFSTSTGYTLSNCTIASGQVELSSAFEGTGTCQTPTINTSTWFMINRVDVTQSESVDNVIRYLCSFDGGTTWNRNLGGFWEEVDASEISTKGMEWSVFQRVRFWDNDIQQIAFLISFTRSDDTIDSSVSQITIYYKASEGQEQYDVLPEPASTGNLEDDLGIQPDFPVSITYERSAKEVATEGNYLFVTGESTSGRRKYSLSFENLTVTEKNSVVSFLNDHKTTPFVWESAPLTDGTMKFYCHSEVNVKQSEPRLFTVSVKLMEAK